MIWEEVLSNEVLDIRDGTHDSPKYLDKGFSLITSKNLKQGKIDFNEVSFISEDDYNAINKRSKVDKGDILYSMIGSIGNYAFIDEKPDYAIKNVALFKFVDHRLDNRYFLFLLNSPIINRQINMAKKGGTQKFVSLGILRNLKIPLPPLNQQKKIAAILDAADAYRQKTKALITKYDELTQSLFLDMFGDPVLNPMGWEMVKFSSIGTLDRGKSKHRPRNDPKLLGGKYPLIQTGDVANCDGFIREYSSTYSEFGLNQSRLWDSGTLCITIAANIAKTGILKFDACFPDSIVGFINNEKSNIEYVKFWMSFLQKILEDSAPMAAQKNINLKILRELEIPLPSIEHQKNFSKKVISIEEQKQLAKASFQKAEDLFNCLLQKAFKGELTQRGDNEL